MLSLDLDLDIVRRQIPIRIGQWYFSPTEKHRASMLISTGEKILEQTAVEVDTVRRSILQKVKKFAEDKESFGRYYTQSWMESFKMETEMTLTRDLQQT